MNHSTETQELVGSTPHYRFLGMEFDPMNLELFRDGERDLLQPLPARLLLHLLKNRHRIVPKDELHAVIWPSTFVSDAAIASTLRDLRRGVRDQGQEQVVIRTYRGRGYRFVAALEFDDDLDLAEIHLPLSSEETGQPDLPEVPFVGRILELQTLDQRLQQAVEEGKGSLTVMLGIVGLGKSTLLDQFSRLAGETVLVQYRVRRELWKPPRATLGDILTRLCDEIRAPGSANFDRADSSFDGQTRIENDPQADLEPIEKAFRWIAQVAQSRPITILIDDLHEADVESALLLLGLAPKLAEHRVMIVASVDPGLLNSTVAKALTRLRPEHQFQVPGLDLTATERMADSVMACAPDTPWLRALHHHTGGYPCATLSLLRFADGAGPSPPSPEELPLPEGWIRTHQSRLGKLPAASQHLIVAATVLPPETDLRSLALVAGLDGLWEGAQGPAILGGWLRTGARKDLVRFATPLLRRVVLLSVSAERRQQLAARAARLGIERPEAKVRELEPVLLPEPH